MTSTLLYVEKGWHEQSYRLQTTLSQLFHTNPVWFLYLVAWYGCIYGTFGHFAHSASSQHILIGNILCAWLGVGISLVTLVLSRLCLSFCLACASSFGEVWHAWWSLLQGFYCQIRCKRLFFGVLFFLIGLCLCLCSCAACLLLWSSPVRSTLNTGYITGVDMCKVCTEAVQSVALWTRVTLQVWTCVKYVLKQSSP